MLLLPTLDWAAEVAKRYVASVCDELVFSSLSPESSLYPLVKTKIHVLML